MAFKGFGKDSGPFSDSRPPNTQLPFGKSQSAPGSTFTAPPPTARPSFPSKTVPFFGLSPPASNPAEPIPKRQPTQRPSFASQIDNLPSLPASSPTESIPQRQPTRRPSFPSKINNISSLPLPNSFPTPRAPNPLQPSPPRTAFHDGTQTPRGPYPPSSYPTYRTQAIPSTHHPPTAVVPAVPRSSSPKNRTMNGASSPRTPSPPDSQPHLPRSPSPPNYQPHLSRSSPPQESPLWQTSSGMRSQPQLHLLPPEQRHKSISSSCMENDSSHFLEERNRSSHVSWRPLSPSMVTKESHTPDRSLVSLRDEPTRSNTSPSLVNWRTPLADHANGLDQTISHTAASSNHVNERTFMSSPNSIGVLAQKRNRSPASTRLSEQSENLSESEREIHAKAKRLARFGAELNQPVPSVKDSKWNKSPVHKLSDKRYLPGTESGKMPEESFNNIPDVEGQVESSTVITGLCQDMCPASEREERERKGDLDQYERLDGDRNQTNRLLAVKKYNRMAEREALLIRPMPVLQMTVNYLLQLLDQPYTDKFLGIYNFLWDRMRAIRMDLRMQHLFNQEAITMLEQMIRLHIIAMHELCEYKKGEGFSEGFDAHLNIEQMNKTSVELFQMYDDHRKMGIDVPTEKEFRGYYALLKLDKHPGYKVEPAELSLDLAKMTPEIRGTTEILFARAVARACRTGNFIAFFRLARKATYHQACLMHAHFSKLRTLALASLHSGLQNNQGIPVEQVVKWLAMEGEDMEALLEYHGFAIKHYQEAYMVKEGSFLNRDVDYPTKCSELVDNKKSANIVDDVSSGQAISDTSSWISVSGFEDQSAYSVTNTRQSDKVNKSVHRTEKVSISHQEKEVLHDAADLPALPFMRDQITYTTTTAIPVEENQTSDDEEMDDFDDGYPASYTARTQLTFSKPSNGSDSGPGYAFNEVYQRGGATDLKFEILSGSTPYEDNQVISCVDLPTDEVASVDRDERPVQVQRMEKPTSNFKLESPASRKGGLDQKVVLSQENEALRQALRDKYEAAREQLKIILRIWRQNASMKRETREQRQHLASIAMNALSLGPPFHQNEIQNIESGDKLSMDTVIWRRDERREKSWSRLNVAKLIRPILDEKNSVSCHCWKLIICVQKVAEDRSDKLISTWLSSKLMGAWNEDVDELVVPMSNLSIWKDFSNGGSHIPESCCFCVVRTVLVDGCIESALNAITLGANAIVYLLSEALPCQIQRAHINAILESIPHQAGLPLLILHHNACKEVNSDLITKLGLDNIDETKISSISVVSLSGEHTEQVGGFFSDEKLKQGLQWLAEQSPIMPSLHLVKTRNIVLNFLGSSFQTFNNMRQSEVDPGNYISVFNEALDLSVGLVVNTANSNINCWPCPEIDLLESSFDRKLRDALLASTNWSSSTKIDPILSSLEKCKLPVLQCDISWLGQGSCVKKEILDKKSSLEKCLYDYLTVCTEIMSGDLAAEEARIMVQKGTTLVLQNSEYYIKPRWGLIFRRIYNWRLRSLTSKECTFAYVTDDFTLSSAEESFCSDMGTPCKSKSEMSIPLENHEHGNWLLTSILAEPSLDELIESGCGISSGPHTPGVGPPETLCNSGKTSLNGYIRHAPNDQDYLLGESSDTHSVDFRNGVSSTQIEAIPVYKSDKLALLLEKCNMLQNSIDEKLSLYF